MQKILLILVAALFLAPGVFGQVEFPEETFSRKKAKTNFEDPKAVLKLAFWCNKKQLSAEADELFYKVLDKNPNNQKARKALGYQPDGQNWVASDYRKSINLARKVVGEKFVLPSKEALEQMAQKSKAHKKMVRLFGNKENWAQALVEIDKKTGLWGKREVSVDIKLVDVPKSYEEKVKKVYVWGGGYGHGTTGKVRIFIDDLILYQKRVRELKADKDVLSKKKLLLIPFHDPKKVLVHELTHALQGRYDHQALCEGACVYASSDNYFYYFFSLNKYKKKPKPMAFFDLDHVPSKNFYAYGRGASFYEWIDQNHGRTKVKMFFKNYYRKKMDYQKAAEEALDMPWEQIYKEENAWSKKFVAQFDLHNKGKEVPPLKVSKK